VVDPFRYNRLHQRERYILISRKKSSQMEQLVGAPKGHRHQDQPAKHQTGARWQSQAIMTPFYLLYGGPSSKYHGVISTKLVI
jgi:hypothetical protein